METKQYCDKNKKCCLTCKHWTGHSKITQYGVEWDVLQPDGKCDITPGNKYDAMYVCSSYLAGY